MHGIVSKMCGGFGREVIQTYSCPGLCGRRVLRVYQGLYHHEAKIVNSRKPHLIAQRVNGHIIIFRLQDGVHLHQAARSARHARRPLFEAAALMIE